MTTAAEKRRDLRVLAQLQVAVPGAPTRVVGVTRNVGLSGMYLLTQEPWQQGVVVDLELQGSEYHQRLKAVVIHRQAGGVGLKFIEMTTADEDGLMMLLDRLLVEGARWDERRRERRRRADGTAVWHRAGRATPATLHDLSTQGARVGGSGPWPEAGIEIELDLSAPESGAARCNARVVHVGDAYFGVEFREPSPAFIAVVRALLADGG